MNAVQIAKAFYIHKALHNPLVTNVTPESLARDFEDLPAAKLEELVQNAEQFLVVCAAISKGIL